MSRIIKIENDRLRVEISSKGAELQSIADSCGVEYLWNGDPSVWSGRAPVLFPICGGLKEDRYLFEDKEYKLAKHGFARRSEFEVEEAATRSATFLLRSSEETKAAYPFNFEFRVRFELRGERLDIRYAVKNTGERPLYFSVGSHEAYACPEGIEEYDIIFDKAETLDSFLIKDNLLFPEMTRVLENQKVLPLKYDYFAVDALAFRNIASRKVTLAHKKSDKKVVVEFDEFEYFLLWTKPGANYICVELNCGIDDLAFSSYKLTEKAGIIKLEASETFEVNHSISPLS